MNLKRQHLLVLVYIGVGIFVAWERSYLTLPILKIVGSVVLAILFWWLLLLGVNLHIH
jgi:hypothetical protein